MFFDFFDYLLLFALIVGFIIFLVNDAKESREESWKKEREMEAARDYSDKKRRFDKAYDKFLYSDLTRELAKRLHNEKGTVTWIYLSHTTMSYKVATGVQSYELIQVSRNVQYLNLGYDVVEVPGALAKALADKLGSNYHFEESKLIDDYFNVASVTYVHMNSLKPKLRPPI